MSQLADDTVAHAEKIAESDACRERMAELITDSFDREDQFEYVITTLREEFITNDHNIQDEVPGFGNLLVTAFERRAGELYRHNLEARLNA